MEKQCKACEVTKELTQFVADGRTSDKRAKVCVDCTPKKTQGIGRGNYNRLTHDAVKKTFEDAGCSLITETYKNNFTKMRYICTCGNEAEIDYASFKSGSRCVKCKSRKAADRMRKYSIEDVREIFNLKGFTLLSKEYKSTKSLLEYICVCGNTHSARLNSILYQNSKCPECKREALSGANHYLWKAELTDEERGRNKSRLNIPEVSRWRRRVFKRDNHTCNCCGKRGGGTLHAHHIDGWHWCIDKRHDDDNGATLCAECHSDFHAVYGKGDNTRSQYEEWVENKQKKGA